MKLKERLISLAILSLVFLVVYSLGDANAWLAFFIAYAVTVAHDADLKGSWAHKFINEGLVTTFQVNDDMHSKATQRIDELTAQIEDLEEKIRAIEDRA